MSFEVGNQKLSLETIYFQVSKTTVELPSLTSPQIQQDDLYAKSRSFNNAKTEGEALSWGSFVSL